MKLIFVPTEASKFRLNLVLLSTDTDVVKIIYDSSPLFSQPPRDASTSANASSSNTAVTSPAAAISPTRNVTLRTHSVLTAQERRHRNAHRWDWSDSMRLLPSPETKTVPGQHNSCSRNRTCDVARTEPGEAGGKHRPESRAQRPAGFSGQSLAKALVVSVTLKAAQYLVELR